MQKTCIIIAGPTAIGKTDISIQLAAAFSTEIISADSRQCYRELNIGVAKPDAVSLEYIHHHFINSHSIHVSLSAADFETYALQKVSGIFEQHDVAIMVGGTGLYINAFAEGMDQVPAVADEYRLQVIEGYKQNGITWLQDMLNAKDPDFAKTGEMQNPQRMMRALEVVLSTGKSIRSFQLRQKKSRSFRIIKIGLQLPREILYERINQRVDMMITAGLEEEARSVLPFRHLQALQTVGYREWFDGWDQGMNREMIIEKIKQNTRHYAKRQMTWFKRDEQINWIQPEMDAAMAIINEKLKKN